MASPPSVEEARPGRCPACGVAGRPVCGRLGLYGHGRRDRQQRGPVEADASPVTAVVAVRRYRCVGCSAVIAVVPCDVEPRRHYSRPAIALALALWSLAPLPAAEVRRRISPWPVTGTSAAGEGWVALRRWARAGRAGHLFRRVGRRLGGSLRRVAAHLAEIALGHAPPALRHASREARIFHGAVTMA